MGFRSCGEGFQMQRVRREVYFSGRVQGVGFRYTAIGIAAKLDVTGFVCNLPDDRVFLVAEGVLEEIDRLLEGILAEMRGNVRDTEIREAPATGEFRDFGVRRGLTAQKGHPEIDSWRWR